MPGAIHHKSSPIICIGGSAGAFKAIEQFFKRMPSDSGMSFVIIMHLDKSHSGSIADLIQTFTPMPVKEAADGQQVEHDCIYVIPRNKDIGIHNRKLLLLNPVKSNGYHLPIDYFLQCLAEDQWNRAVAVIMSGMGSDGETGVRMVKEKLGMVMAQDPETAEYSSMPESAISTNLVDYVLSPEEMPLKLIQYLNHPAMAEEINQDSKNESRNATAIQKILMLLRSHTGHDFSQYKKNTITRRIDRRLAFHQLPDYAHYIAHLRENPHEIDVLFHELLIGVTKFFRDHPAYDMLKEKLFGVLRQKAENDAVRVWIAGCSTGEEAYSVAMLLMECLNTMQLRKLPKVQIFATDLDAEAIETARQGIYFENIAADVSPERLERFFIQKETHYVVKKELREMIVFAQHNIVKDAPFTRLDLLCCRNVLIYLTVELQRRIIPVFHYSLNPKGLLFLGPAETIGGFSEMFVSIDPKWKLFERKEGTSFAGKMLDFPFNVSKQQTPVYKMDESKPLKKKTLAETYTKLLLDKYTPASVLVNEKGDILYINGRPGKFLELNSGEAIMNINNMAREELKYALSNAIHQAQAQKSPVTVGDIKIKDEDTTRLVDLKVELLQDTALHGLTLVIFEDKGAQKKSSKKKKETKTENSALAEELEKELVYTKQQLQSTIEQMETSLEELKSTNEELQSTNEELQSTNEESLTTKEEMQSLNEELMTINVQYQAKAEELTQLNNDMKNLLDNTEIGTIFLDTNMTILRFTPLVKKLFNVIPSDVGRSIKDIVFNFDYPALQEDISNVIETLVVKEGEIKTKKGEWYNLRIMPYRTLDNFINGAVLTFSRITPLKELESQLEAFKDYAVNIIETLKAPALLLDKDMLILNANTCFINYFKTEQIELKGMSFPLVVHELWKTSKLDHFLKTCLHHDSEVKLEHDFPNIGTKTVFVSAKPAVNKETDETSVVMIMVTEQK